jgi:hypothetical protein
VVWVVGLACIGYWVGYRWGFGLEGVIWGWDRLDEEGVWGMKALAWIK